MLLPNILPEIARVLPSTTALKQGSVSISYQELFQKTSRLADSFRTMGIKPGQRLALLGEPNPELVIAEYAATALGAIPFAVFTGLARTEVLRILEDAAPSMLVYDQDMAIKLGWPSNEDSLTGIYVRHADDREGMPLSHLIEQGNVLPVSDWHQAGLNDPAVLIYTGGTTGRAKGVIHTHQSIKHWFNVNPPGGLGHAPHQKSICFNMAHLTGQSVLWMTLAAGGCVHFFAKYPADAGQVISLIERENITHVGTVGGLLREILNELEQQRRTLPSVRVVTCGGAPMHPDTLRRAAGLFTSAMILNVYSQTESGTMISMLPILRESTVNEQLLSVGRPEAMMQFGQKPFHVRIVDEQGKDLPVGHTGEIIVQGQQIMAGYWNNPSETANALRSGWLYTGDAGYLDEHGYLFLMDRKKEIIIVDGANVYASEVEVVLERHPAIQEAAVVGISRGMEGETVAAVVVLISGEFVDLGAIRDYLAERLASFKLPSILKIEAALPRTIVGKIDKKAVKQLAEKN